MKPFTVLVASLAAALPLAAQPFGAAANEFRVNTYTTGEAQMPVVAYPDTNTFVVAWTGEDPTDPTLGIFARRYDSGRPSGAQLRVNTYTDDLQYAPRIGAVPYGSAAATRFVVVWVSRSQDGDSTGVFAQRYGVSGPLGAEFQVNTYTTGLEYARGVALDANGDFVIVWQQPDADVTGIFARRYAANGDAQGPLFRVNVFTTGAQGYPSVARSPNGDFVVVWQSEQEFGTMTDIVGRRFSSAGAPATGDFLIEGTTTENHRRPDVAPIGVNAGFVVAWESLPGSFWQISARRFAASGAPSTGAFRVDTVTTTSHYFPAVAANNSGDFVVVWSANGLDGDLTGLFARRYAPDGAPEGDEFRVSSYTTSRADNPRVAMTTAGAFTVVWRGLDLSGDSGIIGKQYCPLQGDADGNNVLDVADVFYLINVLFASGPAPLHPCDANGDGNVDIADVFYLINYLFAGGAAPVCEEVL
jgi:hypothetical protein